MPGKHIDWHRNFGIALMDYFSRSGYEVEVEVDLSVKKQFLDVVIIERTSDRGIKRICDGFDNLRTFNLLTYKSLRESLTVWALEELIGHYVNFRKTRGMRVVKPTDISLYAICTRFPAGLSKRIKLEQIGDGVLETTVLDKRIRIIVLSQVPAKGRNAIWELFSGVGNRVRHGAETYRWKERDCSSVVNQLYWLYDAEGIDMPYTIEQFKKDMVLDHIDLLDPEDRLKGLRAEDRLRGLRADERLKGLRAEERLKDLSVEEIEAYLRKISRKRK